MTQEEINKLPTILDILDAIAAEEENLRIDPRWNFLFSNMGVEDKFEIFQEEEGKPYVLKPTSSTVNSYFRGQPDYFEVCVPTIFRDSDNRDDIDVFIDRIRSCEFELLINSHPFVENVFKNGIEIQLVDRVQKVLLKVDGQGLAAHYEFKTSKIDFTNNKWVAAFFAVSKKSNGQYKPVQSDKQGVFYWYNHFPVFDSGNTSNRFSIIGLQPFKRPGEQKAFALDMLKNENLNSFPGVRKYLFRHNDLASEIIYNRLNQGHDLFPPDEIIEYAEKIKKSNKLTNNAFLQAWENYPISGKNETDVKELCYQKGIRLVDYPVVKFNKSLDKDFNKYWREKGENEFLSKIVYRQVVQNG